MTKCIKYFKSLYLTSMLIACFTPCITYAVAYDYPADPSANPPLDLVSGDTLTVSSGLMQTTSGAEYTVQLGDNTSVTVNSGATLSYNFTGVQTAAIFSSRNDATGSTEQITNNGTISNGNGLNSIYSVNSNGGAANTVIINNLGTIIGDIRVDAGSVTLNLTNNAGIQGNLLFNGTTRVLNLGSVSAGSIFVTQGTINNLTLWEIFNNSTLYIANEAFNIEVFKVDAGGIANINAPLGGLTVADGAITNIGTMNIADAINKTGTFTNTGRVNVSQNVNIFTSNYTSTAGTHASVLTDLATYGNAEFLSATPAFSSFVVTYPTYGYFAAGTYTLVNAPVGILTAPTSYTIPSNTMFLLFNTPVADSNTIKISMSRIGFQNYAVTSMTQEIGAILEFDGANSPSSSMLTLLDAVERSQTPAQLQYALQQLGPMLSAPMYAFMLQDQVLEQVELRIASAKSRVYAAAGDGNTSYNFWFRAIGDRANQNPTGDSMGYHAVTGGFSLGLDNFVSVNSLVGGAFTTTQSTVRDKINNSSYTDLKSYQLTFYGSTDFTPCYFDWTFALASNHYDATRSAAFNNYITSPASGYSNQLYGAKFIFGANFRPHPLFQVSPEGSALYSLGSSFHYAEGGGGGANLQVNSQLSNFIQIAAGVRISAPFMYGCKLIVPEIHAKGLYNLANGTQDFTNAFLEGGTFFEARASLPKQGIKYGAAITLVATDRIEFKLNYDHTSMTGYTDNAFYLNFRYAL